MNNANIAELLTRLDDPTPPAPDEAHLRDAVARARRIRRRRAIIACSGGFAALLLVSLAAMHATSGGGAPLVTTGSESQGSNSPGVEVVINPPEISSAGGRVSVSIANSTDAPIDVLELTLERRDQSDWEFVAMLERDTMNEDGPGTFSTDRDKPSPAPLAVLVQGHQMVNKFDFPRLQSGEYRLRLAWRPDGADAFKDGYSEARLVVRD